jgi:hypothetical protein
MFRKFIKSLNWSGAFITLVICGMGAMSRNNESFTTSLMVWGVLGIPISAIFLFVGRDSEK